MPRMLFHRDFAGYTGGGFRVSVANADEFDAAFAGEFGVVAGVVAAEAPDSDCGGS